MLFYPYGQRLGEVVDPKNLSREYQNALRLGEQTTHYQWKENAVSQYSSPVIVSVTSATSVNLSGSATAQDGIVQLKGS